MDADPTRAPDPSRSAEPGGAGARRSGPVARDVLAAAAFAGRRHFWRVLPASIVLIGVTALLETFIDNFVNRHDIALSLVADLGSSAVSTFGVVLLSGLIVRLVGEAGHGGRLVPVGRVLSDLRWATLIGADVVVSLLAALGFLLLILPGFVVLTLLAVVGPVIEIEGRSIRGALRRSVKLVRHGFWTALLLVTIPLVFLADLPASVPDSLHESSLPIILLARGVGGAVIDTALGLVLVELAYELIELDGMAPLPERRGRGHGHEERGEVRE